jgi:hypothetical protein
VMGDAVVKVVVSDGAYVFAGITTWSLSSLALTDCEAILV